MNSLADNLILVIRDLESASVKFALIGAMAVGIRAVERTTRDLDFSISVESDKESESLLYHLQKCGHSLHEILEHKPSGFIACARFIIANSISDRPNLDLLFCHSGIEKEVVAAATTVKFQKMKLPVASLGHLIALKILSESDKRNRDRDDLLRLLERANDSDLLIAKRALSLITERGFNQEKDLHNSLKRFIDILHSE